MISIETTDIYPIISKCYHEDPSMIKYERNNGTLEELAIKEYSCLLFTDKSFKFYIIKDEDLLGYFGTENINNQEFLSIFFIRKKHRNRKIDIWNFIKSHFNGKFQAGLYSVNSRAIKFYKSVGGILVKESICENKPICIFEFGE